jgi:Extensin-like protein C-terminus
LPGIPTLCPVSEAPPARPISRRALLGGTLSVGVTGLATLAACSPPESPLVPPDAYCVPRDTLVRRQRLGDVPMVYEPTGRRQAFWFDAGFVGQLDPWVGELAGDFGRPATRLDTYGSWIDGRGQCDSWHHSGRAFDLAAIQLADGVVVSCRYDLLRDRPAAEVEAGLRSYWALAAGLHLRFAYVLTYLFDARHANHIHLDNGRSGQDLSTFRSRSRVQVQAVQAMLTYLWAEPLELTGRWDGPTRDAAHRVGDQLGLTADLEDATEAWHGFLRATATRGR